MINTDIKAQFASLSTELARELAYEQNPVARKTVDEQSIRGELNILRQSYPLLCEVVDQLARENEAMGGSLNFKPRGFYASRGHVATTLCFNCGDGDIELALKASPDINGYSPYYAATLSRADIRRRFWGSKTVMTPLLAYSYRNGDGFGWVTLAMADRQAAENLLLYAYDQKWVPVPVSDSAVKGQRSARFSGRAGSGILCKTL